MTKIKTRLCDATLPLILCLCETALAVVAIHKKRVEFNSNSVAYATFDRAKGANQ